VSCIAALVQKCKHFFNNDAALQKIKHEYTAISPSTRPSLFAAIDLPHITAGSLGAPRAALRSGRRLPVQEGRVPGSTLVPITRARARLFMQLPCLKKVLRGGKSRAAAVCRTASASPLGRSRSSQPDFNNLLFEESTEGDEVVANGVNRLMVVGFGAPQAGKLLSGSGDRVVFLVEEGLDLEQYDDVAAAV